MKKKAVLSFSGGLDTSYCAIYLAKELDYEVITVTINTGGFNDQEKKQLEERSKELGVNEHYFIDCTEEYYESGVRYLLFGNVLKNNTYPLSVSAERIFQAKAIAEFANSIKADAIVHGSTGAGNDQVRFDLTFLSLCQGIELITPIRDLGISRQEEIAYLEKHGIHLDWKKAQYSINQGLWGTSVGGKETLTSDQYLPEEAFPGEVTGSKSTKITIAFNKGEPVKVNDIEGTPVEMIQYLNELGSSYGIGRDIHVGDTIIGIKGRVGFEAPAALMLIKAHHLLEKHVLSKNQLFIKDQLSAWYGNLMHEGLYLDPAMRDLEAFLQSSQEAVTGEVDLLMAPYRFQTLGIRSDFDLMKSEFGDYGEINKSWSAEDARGFARIFATQNRLYHSLHK
jgi:argininosuccinate synthase